MAAATSHTVVLTLSGDADLAATLAKNLKGAQVTHVDVPPQGPITILVTERATSPQAAADAAVAKAADAAGDHPGEILYVVDPLTGD